MGAIYDKVLDTGKQVLAYKPVRVTLVLITYASSKGSDETPNMRSLTRAFMPRIHKEGVKMEALTKI